MEDLTTAQRRVYDYVKRVIEERHAPPTRAEIARALGFASANAAQSHLAMLARKGYVRLASRDSRGISLVRTDDDPDMSALDNTVDLRVVGRVAAGTPILAVENTERTCRLDNTLFTANPDYLLRVSGDSMIDAGIFDRDLLAVKRESIIAEGAIGVFRTEDEVTVKYYRRDADGVRLAAANPAYADIRIDPTRTQLDIEGRAVGVVRALD